MAVCPFIVCFIIFYLIIVIFTLNDDKISFVVYGRAGIIMGIFDVHSGWFHAGRVGKLMICFIQFECARFRRVRLGFVEI